MEKFRPEFRPDSNHLDEALRIIDETLLAEEVVLESLKQAVERGSILDAEAKLYFQEYRRHLRGEA